jgi:hypothetical protein
MRWSEKTGELVKALIGVQESVGPVTKNAVNPHFKSHYADLGAVWKAVATPLHDNGLLVTQTGAVVAGKPLLVTRVSHVGTGQWVEGEMPLDGGKTDPQGIGAAITYQRRYSLCALFGLMVEDDDGNAARPTPRAAPQATPARPAAAPKAAPVDNIFAREVIVQLKGGVKKRAINELEEQEAEDALNLAVWRLNNVKEGKWADKNRKEAEADKLDLEAYIQALSGVGYATSLPAEDKEPPF